MKISSEWSRKFPTKPGNYWAFGASSIKMHDSLERPRMRLVKVFRGAGGKLIASSEAEFIYKSDFVGVWKEADVPEPPMNEYNQAVAEYLEDMAMQNG